MPGVESLTLAGFAETATDYAHDNALHYHSQLLAPGLNGIAGSPIKPLDEYVQGIPTKDRVLLHDFKIGSVLQPDKREGFTPTTNAIKITPRWASVVEAKINLRFTEKQIVALQKSFFGMMAGSTNAKAKLILDQFPVFEAYFMDMILKKAKAEMRNISMWNGIRNEALQTPGAIFDGWLKFIDELIISEDIPEDNLVAISAITDANAVAEVKKIVKIVPEEYRYSDELVCIMNTTQKDSYDTNYQATRGAIPYNTQYVKQTIEGTNIEMVVEPGLKGYDTPIIISRNNLCFLYDDDYKSLNFKFDYNIRNEDLAVIAKFQAQPEIIAPYEIWMGTVGE